MTVFPRPRWSAGSRLRNPWFWLTLVSYAVPLLVAFVGSDSVPPEVLGTWYPGAAAVIGTASLLLRYSRSEPGWAPTATQRLLAVVVALTMLVSNLAFGGDRVDPLLAAATPGRARARAALDRAGAVARHADPALVPDRRRRAVRPAPA
jgi:hypothetical protein